MKIKVLLAIVVIILFQSCTKERDYQSVVIYKNKSSYTIRIVSDIPLIDITISAGQEFSASKSGDGSFAGNFLYTKNATIYYGSDVSQIHHQEEGYKYNNVCNLNAYVRSENGRKEIFEFVFTDADYEYAKNRSI